MSHRDIRIGTLVRASDGAEYIRQILPHGFESFQLTFWRHIGDLDLQKLADEIRAVLDAADGPDRPVISALGVYGNPLVDDQTAQDFGRAIDACKLFGCDIVAGFAGRVVDKPVPDSIPRYKEVFGPLAQRAADQGVRIAFENCDMGGDWQRGDWNIAHSPHAWELMFDALPADNIGLEWEPCHQMVSLVDPLAQLRQWVGKVFHLHGKDATVMWDVIRARGIRGGQPYVYHRHPGLGDTDWRNIITILRLGGFTGSIDIEGWHDPVYRGELEMTGQVHALNYLKWSRGGPFIPNPTSNS